jgi:hypothetical protein
MNIRGFIKCWEVLEWLQRWMPLRTGPQLRGVSGPMPKGKKKEKHKPQSEHSGICGRRIIRTITRMRDKAIINKEAELMRKYLQFNSLSECPRCC